MEAVTYAAFAGHFTFAGGKSLPPLVGTGWDAPGSLPGLQPPTTPNLWVPWSDGTALKHLDPSPDSKSDRRLALEWIQFIATHILPRFCLRLEGEVWYQGKEALDTGRFYADADGNVARQTIKLCPGVAGAAACDDVAALQKLPLQAVKAKDGFGRTAAMLAALFNSWAVLQHLLYLPNGIDWSETQPAQIGYAGKTAMHYLCSNAPTAAAASHHAQAVQLLPEMLPATILNTQDAQGLTPLTLAVKSRNMTMLQWLLTHGADPNTTNPTRPASRPITAAVQLKDPAYLEKLLAYGANVHCRDVFYKTPLSHALDLQHRDHLQLLVLYGANLDAHHIQFRHGAGHSQTIRHIISDFPAGTSGAGLKAAMVQGLAARRHLVVLTLGARVAPDLSQDILQLICQYSLLMP